MKENIVFGLLMGIVLLAVYFTACSINNNYKLQTALICKMETNLIQSMKSMNKTHIENMKLIAPTNLIVEVD